MSEEKNVNAEPLGENVKVVDREAASGTKRDLPKWLDWVVKILLLVTALYHLYAAGIKPLPGIQHTAVHLGLGIAIIMIFFPASKRLKNSKILLGIDLAMAALSLFNMFYVSAQYETLAQRIGMPPSTIEVILGLTTIVVMFLAAFRTMGLAFPIIAIIFVIYMFVGPYLPGLFFHTGITLERFVSAFYLTMNGIYGSITKTSADVIVLYIMFSAIIKNSPIGDFIMDLATAAFGKFRGGPAKVACVSSGLMGMLSGSAVANVAGTGCITIPMMKKAGYPSKFAGAVEAAASTGGQIMPPVMGGSVFIMVELINSSYNKIMLIALPIAILFYIGLLIIIDLKAVDLDLKGIDVSDRPSVGKVLKEGWYLSAPVIALIAFLLIGWTAQRSGFWAIIIAIVVSFISPKDRMTFKKLINSLMEGVKDSAVIFAVVGLASLIQGIVTTSGLGLRMSSIMVEASGGSVLLLLFLTAVASIVLGMGLPVIVCYTFLALLIAPGMVDLGVPLVAAHMFIFYYGCLSSITPPVALASLVAAGIAKSKPMETGLEACKVAFPIFFIPFFFVYRSEILLMDGFTFNVLLDYLWIFLGLFATSAGFAGATFPRIKIKSKILRILLVLAGIIILVPAAGSEPIGTAILVAVHVYLFIANRKKTKALAT